jgi:hypothetical protein
VKTVKIKFKAISLLTGSTMVNRTRIRVGYDEPYKALYYGMDVMLMDFQVEMVPIEVDGRVSSWMHD